MTHHLKITDEAANLLFSIARRYAEESQSIEIAGRWYDGFIDTLQSLEQNPRLGSVAPENGLFEFELRELLYGSGHRLTHRALYRIVGDTVEVLTIRHHAQRPLERRDL